MLRDVYIKENEANKIHYNGESKGLIVGLKTSLENDIHGVCQKQLCYKVFYEQTENNDNIEYFMIIPVYEVGKNKPYYLVDSEGKEIQTDFSN